MGPIARGVSVDTQYRYSADGELVEALDQARGKTEYRYDPVGQLLAMVPQQARQELFRFDPRGNLYEADAGAPQRVYGKGNRLLQKGDTHYRWDDDGRLVEKRIKSGAATDRRGVALPLGRRRPASRGRAPRRRRVRFAYDPFARRVSKEVREPRGALAHAPVSRTRFVWDGDVLAHEIREPAIEAEDHVVYERTFVFKDRAFCPLAHKEGNNWYHYVNGPSGKFERLLDDLGGVAGDVTTKAGA